VEAFHTNDPADVQADNHASLGEMTPDLEKEQIASARQIRRQNQSATALALGLALRQLRYRSEKLYLIQDCSERTAVKADNSCETLTYLSTRHIEIR